MKIFNLNVNNFGGLNDEKPRREKGFSKSEYIEQRDGFQESPQRINTMEAIVLAIDKERPDMIIFQEFDVIAPAGREMTRRLALRSYAPVYPDKERNISGNYSITMMFVKNETAIDRHRSLKLKPWKWCEIGIGELMISGVHFPDGMDYLNDVKEYIKKHTDKKFVIIGDFNISTNGWRAKQQAKDIDFQERRKWLLETMPELGFSDAVTGEPVTYFKKGTTIDHVLVSSALQGRVTTDVKKQSEYGFSDHAVIIVSIDEPFH